MKTTWNNIHKEISNPTNENNVKSLKINNHIVQNQINPKIDPCGTPCFILSQVDSIPLL